jgi:catechol 2,3-dioxygenase-like lactoylglutathione lyase family enzyme
LLKYTFCNFYSINRDGCAGLLKPVIISLSVKHTTMKIGSIVIRCYEFDKMLAFWQEALHYVPRAPASGGWVVLQDPEGKGPNISLDQVPEKRRGKRSRLHLDLYTSNQAAEVERLIQLGARRYPWRYPEHADYVVLADPDDNLFCVVQKNG